MGTSAPAVMASQYTPTTAETTIKLATAIDYVNELIRDLHVAGSVVLVSDVLECHTGEHPLPQIRVDVREPANAISRPEELDA